MKTIVTLGIVICGYAFSQAQICDPTITPSNLSSVVSLTDVTLSWDHTPGSAFARVIGTAPTGNNISKFITTTTPGVEPSALIIPLSVLSNGEYTWRVVSACNFFPPYMPSAPSEPDTFSVGGIVDCGLPLTDAEGNVYATVQIGDQCWMAENLKTTLFANGDSIPTDYTCPSSTGWGVLTSPAFGVYDDDPGNFAVYGNLYNWYTAFDSRNVCPAGWHVPSDLEWLQFESYLGSDSLAYRMKSEFYWNGDNSIGFNALPAGYLTTAACGDALLGQAYFWTSTSVSSVDGYSRCIITFSPALSRPTFDKNLGSSIRCVQD
jgi:uncharacterized protein (TIGR02145 family)